MSIFTRWRERKSGGDSASVLRELLTMGAAKSGVAVTWRTALQATTAFACARVISQGLAQVPFKLYRERSDGGSDAARDDDLFELLYRRPNEFQTAYEFWEQRAFHLVFTNNAYALKVRAGSRIIELLPYEPSQVSVKGKGWDYAYEVTTVDGQRITIPKEDMWHSRGPSWDGVLGLDAVKLAREAIGLSLATEEHGSRLFANGAQPGGVLSTDQQLNPDQRKLLKESWVESTSGTKKFDTAVLWGGLKWNPMSMPNDNAQFLETRKFQVEEICRAMGVMPIMVGHGDKSSTYASAEQMFLAHVVHTMGPWYRRLEQSAEVALLSEEQRRQGMYYRFSVNALMRGSFKDRGDYYTKMYQIGALNPNEIRGFEEMNPYEGGNEYRVPLNMAAPGGEPDTDTDDDTSAPSAGGTSDAAP